MNFCTWPGCNLVSAGDILCAIHRGADPFPGVVEPVTLGEGPSYYDWHPSGLQAKDVAQEFSYNVGTAIAYLWRAGRKPGSTVEEDIGKAIDHLEFELERLQDRK